ncbi:hypothetical protein AVEN_1453-1, partial [Araneus ventricosus]
IGLFNDELESISLKFYKVLGNMNLAENANVEQFKDAFEAYAAGGTSLPDKYYHAFGAHGGLMVEGSGTRGTKVAVSRPDSTEDPSLIWA